MSKVLIACIGVLFAMCPGNNANADDAAITTLNHLARDSQLRLTSDKTSSSDKFTIELQATKPKIVDVDILVQRDGPRSAMLIRSPDGIPFAYVTNGCAVSLDPTTPGALILHENPEFTFVFQDNPAGGVVFNVHSGQKSLGSQILFDLPSVFHSLAAKVSGAKIDKASGALIVETDKTVVEIHPAARPATQPAASFAVARAEFHARNGGTIAIKSIRVGGDPNRSIVGVTVQRVRALKLPIQPPDSQEGVNRSAFPPPGFWRDERNRAAGEKLRKLFPALAEDVPTTRPASTPQLNPATAPRKSDDGVRTLRQASEQLKKVQTITSGMSLSVAQRQQITDLLTAKREKLSELQASHDAGAIPEQEMAEAVKDAIQVIPALRKILHEDQFVEFGKRWLFASNIRSKPNAFLTDDIPKLTAAFQKVKPTKYQEDHFVALLVAVGKSYQQLRQDAEQGAIGPDTLSQRIAASRKQLFDGTKALLAPKQFEQFRAEFQPVPPATPSPSLQDRHPL